MLLENADEQTVLISIFDPIDTLLKSMSRNTKRKLLPTLNSKGGRPSKLCLSETITLALFRYAVGINDVKHYHRHLLSHYSKWFPNRIPNYSSFNRLINQATPYVIFLLQCTMHYNRNDSKSLHFIDTTRLKVCENKRIFNHQVCKGLAERGKNSLGYFFGFKLHAVCDSLGRLVSLMITPGNTDDRKFVIKLLKGLKGTVVGDAGYVSKELMKELSEQGILFLTGVRKNMKRLMTKSQHELLKLRQRIEGVFCNLKYRLKAESSLARSPLGYLSRCIYACLAFCIFQRIEENDLMITG